MLGSFIVTIVVVVAAALLVWFVVIPQFSRISLFNNREFIPFAQYYSLSTTQPIVVIDNQILRDAPEFIVENIAGTHYVYIPHHFVRDNIDPFLFWDRGAGAFFASTRYEMLEFAPGRNTFTINGNSTPLATPLRMDNDHIMLPADLIQGLYGIAISYHPENSIVAISTTEMLAELSVGTLAASSPVKFRPEMRSPLIIDLAEGDTVYVFTQQVRNDYYRVRTTCGLVGYLAREDVASITTTNQLESLTPMLSSGWVENLTPLVPNWDGGPINLVWEAAHNQDANLIRMQTPFHHSVTAVSPTWFDFNMDTMGLTINVSRDYVEWAQAQGVYVWPKVFDMNNATARAILMNRDARTRVINQLVHAVDTYNLDGINIDIEHLLSPEEGPYKIQFLRELAIPMRQRDVVLSAAVKIPAPWTMFYRRDLIALTVDFVAVMTYDEHYNTSAVAGPVASLPWVQQAVNNMLLEVPREQLIMGIPFFNRAWREVVLEDGPPRALNWSMTHTQNFFAEHGVEWVWDSQVGSYYGEVAVIEDGQAVRYRVWLEDARSIEAKMQIYLVYDLAGVGIWRRGFETPDIWNILGQHF